MVIGNKSVTDVVERYFHVTNLLLQEVKRQGMIMDNDSEEALKLRSVIQELSTPFEQADQVRHAFLDLSLKIQSELHRLHGQGLYPDIYCGTTWRFKLMEDIIQLHRYLLMNIGDIVPEFTLVGTSRIWRDKGLFDFVTDQQTYLGSAKFESLWEAVQCFEMQRYLILQLFESLDITDNL